MPALLLSDHSLGDVLINGLFSEFYSDVGLNTFLLRIIFAYF
jgi:hypothetical protein